MTAPVERNLAHRYLLRDILAQGSAGSTYAATDLSGEKHYVVKELVFQQLQNWKNLELFEREVRVLAQLEHPQIPALVEYFEEESATGHRLYLVTHRAPGDALSTLLYKGWAQPETWVLFLAQQILDMLDYLHRFNPPIIHRDLKPSNLVYDPETQRVYLIDFGGVQELLYPEDCGGATIVGTFGYMAPEQYQGRAVPASDLYSLGATLIHLLTGLHPAELPQKNLKILFRPHVECTAAIATWLETLCQPKLSQRFTSAAEAQSQLHLLTGKKALRPHMAKPRTFTGPLPTRTINPVMQEAIPLQLPSLATVLPVLPLGTILHERYHIDAILGQGSAVITYAATDNHEQQPVIIKELHFADLKIWKNYELFEREIKALRTLKHPRVPYLLDYFENSLAHGARLYLVSTRVPGITLAEKMQRGWRPSAAEIWQIADQVLEILTKMQTPPGFIHRDIKPSNLVMDEQGQVYLIDFGAVHHYIRPEGTGGSTVIGTFGYMAPEQFIGKAALGTDLYSLAMTLIHLLAGRSPAQMPQNELRPDFEPFLNCGPELLNWLNYLSEPALEKRCQSAQQARAILRDLTSNLSQLHLAERVQKFGPVPKQRLDVSQPEGKLKIYIPSAPELTSYLKWKKFHAFISKAFLFSLPLQLGICFFTTAMFHQFLLLVLLLLGPQLIFLLGFRLYLDNLWQPQHMSDATLTINAECLTIKRSQDNYEYKFTETMKGDLPVELFDARYHHLEYNHQIPLHQIQAITYQPVKTFGILYKSHFQEFKFHITEQFIWHSILPISLQEARWLHTAMTLTIADIRPEKAAKALLAESTARQATLDRVYSHATDSD